MRWHEDLTSGTGLNVQDFASLVDDRSGRGWFCSDAELRIIFTKEETAAAAQVLMAVC